MIRPCYRSSVSGLISTQNEGDLNFGRINTQLTVLVRSRTGRSPRRPRTSHTAAASSREPRTRERHPRMGPRQLQKLLHPEYRGRWRASEQQSEGPPPQGLADDDRWQIGAPGADAHRLSFKAAIGGAADVVEYVQSAPKSVRKLSISR